MLTKDKIEEAEQKRRGLTVKQMRYRMRRDWHMPVIALRSPSSPSKQRTSLQA